LDISHRLIARSIRSYLLSTNVQLGATYKASQVSTAAFTEAYEVAAGFINARPDEVLKRLGIEFPSADTA
jgi:hypothetical protein